ncbi:MAG: hypothetical protein DLM72_11255 [Candidatus Nitrosopolaris wilkensis]|nr:MAG: hypothetical protein DLM72_11255 [Candidatus Nitrosopolaris wilkensis]
MIWFCILSQKQIDTAIFEKYYGYFERKYLGGSSIRGGFFQIQFFDRLLDKFLRSNHLREENPPVPVAHMVLECLAINRSITFDKLVQKIREANENFWNVTSCNLSSLVTSSLILKKEDNL